MLCFQQHPHRAPSSWTATASAASITRWWWGWQSCCRSCASTASRWPSAACRYGAATHSPRRVCAGGLSPPHTRESPRVAPASRATAPISCAKQGCGHPLGSTFSSRRWRLRHPSAAAGCGVGAKAAAPAQAHAALGCPEGSKPPAEGNPPAPDSPAAVSLPSGPGSPSPAGCRPGRFPTFPQLGGGR